MSHSVQSLITASDHAISDLTREIGVTQLPAPHPYAVGHLRTFVGTNISHEAFHSIGRDRPWFVSTMSFDIFMWSICEFIIGADDEQMRNKVERTQPIR